MQTTHQKVWSIKSSDIRQVGKPLQIFSLERLMFVKSRLFYKSTWKALTPNGHMGQVLEKKNHRNENIIGNASNCQKRNDHHFQNDILMPKRQSLHQSIKNSPQNWPYSALRKLTTLFLFFSFHHEQMVETSVGATISISDLENSEYMDKPQTTWTPKGFWAIKDATGVHVSAGLGVSREKQENDSGMTPVAPGP